jgi:hypothetical protein
LQGNQLSAQGERPGAQDAEYDLQNKRALVKRGLSRKRFFDDESDAFLRRCFMKRIVLLLLCFVVFAATLIPFEASAQRRRSRFGRKARTAAIIAGGAAVGAIAGGKKGAAIGAGGAGLYAFNRRAARRNFKGRTRTIGTVASGTALGAGVGGAVGGKRAAAIGALAGAGGSALYRRSQRRTRRY